jgi:hypothetical protein
VTRASSAGVALAGASLRQAGAGEGRRVEHQGEVGAEAGRVELADDSDAGVDLAAEHGQADRIADF